MDTMPSSSSSWRSLGSSAQSRLHKYISSSSSSASSTRSIPTQSNPPQANTESWRQWAKRRTVGGTNAAYDSTSGQRHLETISLFPGWATKRYRKVGSGELQEAYEIDLFISGFAASHTPPENASRSQRAFMRLARGFASLPKIVADAADDLNPSLPHSPHAPLPPRMEQKLSKSTEDLLASVRLPPRPEEITEDYDVEIKALERQFQRANTVRRPNGKSTNSTKDGGSRRSSVDSTSEDSSAVNSGEEDEVSPSAYSSRTTSSSNSSLSATVNTRNASPNPMTTLASDARKLHANLEARLRPFWSSVIAGRAVRISLFGSREAVAEWLARDGTRTPNAHMTPIQTTKTHTLPDGSFAAHVKVSWEEMCTHPVGLGIVFGGGSASPSTSRASSTSSSSPYVNDTNASPSSPTPSTKPQKPHEQEEEHELCLLVELLDQTVVAPPTATANGGTAWEEGLDVGEQNTHQDTEWDKRDTYGPGLLRGRINLDSPPAVRASGTVCVALTHSPIRLLSDIDDTIKLSNILSGARTVFQNVFVKELSDSVIPGMAEWYRELWGRGVRFHYVSNGPFELLPVVSEFFQISDLPPGSIKLKSYAGRSLFNGLLSAPAARKKQGVLDVLKSFPESRFFLVGDTGEQDLELYAELSQERPDQILAVFVRDATTPTDAMAIEDPTGWGALGADSATPTMGYNTLNARDAAFEDTVTTPRPKLRHKLSNALFSRIPSSASLSSSPPPSPSGTTTRSNYFDSNVVQTEEPDTTPRISSISGPGPSPLNPNCPPSTTTTTTATNMSTASKRPGYTAPSRSASIGTVGSTASTSSAFARLSEVDKKRFTLQERVYRARTMMPGHVPLRVFRQPWECVEAAQIMDRETKGKREDTWR